MTITGTNATITFDGKTFPVTKLGFTMRTQINYPFGDTLEFSCSVENGEIVSQEIVTSGPDVIVSFKLDQGNYLDPSELEHLARRIKGAMSGDKLLYAPDKGPLYISMAKSYLAQHPNLSNSGPGVAFALAEANMNRDYLTMYDNSNVSVEFAQTSTQSATVCDPDDTGDDDEPTEDDYCDGCDDCDSDDWDDDSYDEDDEDNTW